MRFTRVATTTTTTTTCATTTSFLAIQAFLLLLVLGSYSIPVTVWTRSYNNQRTNGNLQETELNIHNVNVKEFGKLFSRTVVGSIYAQILYIPGLDITTKDGVTSKHNVIFVATMANNVYAFDADDSELKDPLWWRNFGPSLPISDGTVGIGEHCKTAYHDIAGEVGIVSTPVIDQATNTMYFVTTNKDSQDPYIVHHRLHAVDVRTGEDRPNSPVVVEGTYPGTGANSKNGMVEFWSLRQNQRLALSLIDDVVYFGFGSYCTMGPYHGWLFGYSKDTLQRKLIFCSTPNTERGSIWQSGQGLVSDGRYIYFITANGHFEANHEWSNSYIKLDPTKVDANGILPTEAVVDYFTPYNWKNMDDWDLDLGTSGPILVPDSDLLFGCSKQGYCYLVNKENMGKFDPNENKNIQYFKPNPNSGDWYTDLTTGTHGSSTTWHSPDKGRLVYVWPIRDTLRAFHLQQNGMLGTFNLDITEKGPQTPEKWGPVEFPGGLLTVSANGNDSNSAIVWAVHAINGSANHDTRSGMIHAYSANDVSKELWNSHMNPCRDHSGNFAKFNTPIITNGKVYVATFTTSPNRECQVHVYGLLPDEQVGRGFVADECCIVNHCGGENCCGGQCYNTDTHYCSNHVVCKKGDVCGTHDPCADCPDSCCVNKCFDRKRSVCLKGFLCDFGNRLCGDKCYDTAKLQCLDGQIIPRPSAEPTTGGEPLQTTTEGSHSSVAPHLTPLPSTSALAVPSNTSRRLHPPYALALLLFYGTVVLCACLN